MSSTHRHSDIDALDTRRADHPVAPLFVNRWSPRAFDGEPLARTELLTVLEAARWAPSAYNVQPWRFSYSLRGDGYWQEFLQLLDPFNQAWAQSAGALVFVFSDTLTLPPGSDSHESSPTHGFDTGAAWAHIALQSTISGYQAHAMAGVLFDDAIDYFALPDRYQLHIAVAIGRLEAPGKLPRDLQQREVPSDRMPLSQLVAPGRFPAQPTARIAIEVADGDDRP